MTSKILSIALLVLIAGIGIYQFVYKPQRGAQQVVVAPTGGEKACTEEAMRCPDGSYVGRTGPYCSFAPCPTSNPAPQEAGQVKGTVHIGPFCPVEREGQPCLVPPEAYTSREVIVYEQNGTTVKTRAKLDTKGMYAVTLAPGTYYIQISPAGIGPGEKKLVTITTRQTSVVDFDIDTGIR